MRLTNYLKSLTTEQRADYAKRCETNTVYLSQLASGFRKPGWRLTQLLSKESGNVVLPHELRPDIFGKPSTPPTPSPAAAHCS